MNPCARHLVLLAVAWIVVQPGAALAQQKKKPPAPKPVYDQYEPSRVLRTGRQDCMRDEDAIGAYCVKACQRGYVSVTNSNPPRCRSIEPLPPGQLAGPLRRETATLPKLVSPQRRDKKAEDR